MHLKCRIKTGPGAMLYPLFFLAACGEYTLVSKEGSDYLIEGQRQRYLRNQTQAEYLLQKAYASPERQVKTEAAFQLAQLTRDQQRHDETVRYLEDAFRTGYDGSPVRLAKAYMNASQPLQNYDKAEAILQAHKGESMDAALTLAKLYIAKDQFEKAIPSIRLAETMYSQSQTPAQDALQIANIYRDIYFHQASRYPGARDHAEHWYSTALKKGESQSAPVELAQLLMHNEPADSSAFKEGMALLQQAAGKNNLWAMEALGRTYYAAGNNEQALYWFTQREQRGDADGSQAYQIAKIYKRTREQPGHVDLMESWYSRAIEKDNKEARKSWQEYQAHEKTKQLTKIEKSRRKEELRQLTDLTPDDEKGFAMLLGPSANKDQAYRHFKALADNGKSVHAMLMVDSWQPEDKKSYIYQDTYKKLEPGKLFSAVMHNAKQLGNAHQGQIVRQWKLAADLGAGEAAYSLARHYESAEPKLAKTWMTRAIDMGSGKALLQKARETAVNAEGEEAEQQTFNWYKKAAEAGEVEGQYQTGLMYAQGKGVAKNIQEAKYWLNQAKNNGYHLASDTMIAFE